MGRTRTPTRSRSLDSYLDAARACILDVGWRRTTLTEVAKRAGVSRMTIYRAWPDMGSLLGDLMTREWVGIAAATQVAAADTTTPEGIAEAALATVRGGAAARRGSGSSDVAHLNSARGEEPPEH